MSPMLTPLTRADRIAAVAAAAAHDLNEELTIIFGSLQMALVETPSNHPAHEYLLDLQASAQRSAWKVSGLLNFTARNGVRPSAATLEGLIEGEVR